jgi:ribosomal protein S18 acetylase RimI-like enzyme
MIRSMDRLAQLMEDWKYYFRNRTWQQAVLTAGKELLLLPYRHIHFLIVARTLQEPLPGFTSDIPFTIRKFDPSDLAGVAEIDRPSEARAFAQRLASGHTGVAALFNQRLVGYAWAFKKVNPDIERIDLKLEPYDFICTDAFTAPAYRKSGIQTLLTLERFRIFRALGYRRALCYIESSNLPSLRAWKKVGGYVVGEIDYFRLGPWRWTHYKFSAPTQIERSGMLRSVKSSL